MYKSNIFFPSLFFIQQAINESIKIYNTVGDILASKGGVNIKFIITFVLGITNIQWPANFLKIKKMEKRLFKLKFNVKERRNYLLIKQKKISLSVNILLYCAINNTEKVILNHS